MNGALIVPAGFLALAVAFELRARWLLRAAGRTESWRPVTGVITVAEMEKTRFEVKTGHMNMYRPRIEYRYRVGQKAHTGTRVYHGADTWLESSEVADRILQRYSMGQEVTVYIDPAEPTEAVLERGQKGGAELLRNAAIVLAAAAVIFGVILTRIMDSATRGGT